jgi:succinyl-diaminopimelate desuccinylase
VSDLSERLAVRTLELVRIPSESRQEAMALRAVRAAMPWEPSADRDSCLMYLPPRRDDVPLVLLAGHVDTVPRAGSPPAARRGNVIVGRGAADMKAGCAVMIEVALDLAITDPKVDVGWVFFGREELVSDESALIPMLEGSDRAREAALAIVMEPTDNAIEIGCLGNLNARVVIRGVAAHSARPWLGDNAIHRAIGVLNSIADLPVRDVDVEGLIYREAVNVTMINGGIAPNVIPDAVTAHINFRYAPTHTPSEAEARLRELLMFDPKVEVKVVSNSRPGPVTLSNPLVGRLRAAGDLPVRPKQAWTPVAEFAEVGIDAVNFGPGDPQYAHRDDERVEIPALVRSHEVLRSFLGSGLGSGHGAGLGGAGG